MLGRTKTRNRDVQSAFHVPCGTSGKGLLTLSAGRSEREAAGVGLKKKADHYPLVLSALVARFLMHLVCDASVAIIEIPVSWTVDSILKPHIYVCVCTRGSIVYQLLHRFVYKGDSRYSKRNMNRSAFFVLNTHLTRMSRLSLFFFSCFQPFKKLISSNKIYYHKYILIN